MPVWPPSLPPPLTQQYRLEYLDPVLRTPMDAGPPKVRRRVAWPGPRVFATWRLTRAEADQLLDWWAGDCAHGSVPFVWYEPSRGRPGRWIWATAPAVSPVAAEHRDVTAELICLEEWWPGVLAGPGRTIRIWDAWAAETVIAPSGSRAAIGGNVASWRDRIAGVLLQSAFSSNIFYINDVDGPRIDVRFFGHMYNTSLSTSLQNAAWVVAVRKSRAAGTPTEYNTRAISWKPVSGYDYSATTGAGLVVANNATAVAMTAQIVGGITIDMTTDRALIMSVNGSVWRLDADNLSVTSTATLAANSAGGMSINSSYHDFGYSNEIGHQSFGGVAVISGYSPTAAERTMLLRWAAALGGRDLHS